MSQPLVGRAMLMLILATAVAFPQQYVISTAAGGAPSPSPVAAINAAIQPNSVAVDVSGNVYFTSSQCVFKVDASGLLTRVAGTGHRGFSGDGGPALNADMMPSAITISSSGDVYVADQSNLIRRVSVSGIISTIAGSSLYNSYAGDGGPAIFARFFGITGLALDQAGNLYVADSGNHRIRRIAIDGTIQTVAGNGLPGNSGDGGPATEATIGSGILNIRGLAVDAKGTIYISVDSMVRKVSTDGVITTAAGTGVFGVGGDGGPAIQAQLTSATGVAVGSDGTLYISESGNNVLRVRRVSQAGIISTAAGGAPAGFSGDGGPATSAQLASATGVAVDSTGNLFIADFGNNRIRRVSGGIITSFAGSGLNYYVGDGGPSTAAQLNSPFFVSVDGAANLIISDFSGQRVRKVSADGVISTIAGVGGPLVIGAAVPDGQLAVTAPIGRPAGVVTDANDNLYIADSDNYCVWKVGADGRIARVAGNLRFGSSGDGGPALQASLSTPWGLALDNSGNLYIADENAHRIRKVSTNGIISTVAGNGIRGYSGDGGAAINASLSTPQSIAVDSSGNLYIADRDNNRIRRVSVGGVITTVAGTGQSGTGLGGGPSTTVAVSLPFGVALDRSGNLYVSDGVFVYKMTADGILTAIAGNLARIDTYSGDGGMATNAELTPSGIAVRPDGGVYVADGYNGAVRLLQPAGPLAMVNGASGAAGPISPGEIVTVYGANLGPDELVTAAPGSDGLYATQLAGVRVTFNGIAAPLIYAGASQVSAVVPYGVDGSTSAQVTVTYSGGGAGELSVPVSSAAPGIFTADSSGSGQAAAINSDGSTLNGAATPAKISDIITLFATGEGQTSPPGMDGKLSPGTPPQPVLQVSVTIGGQSALVKYAGGAPNEVAGVMQVNVQIPSGIQTGDAVPAVLTVGGVPSRTVTISVH